MKIKRLAFLLLILFSFAGQQAIAQTIKITFKYKFVNVKEGADYTSRMKVYLDGKLLATTNDDGTQTERTSTERKETTPNVFSVEIPVGMHKLRAVVESYYEGVWEEHLLSNSYALDCLYERDMNFKEDKNVVLEFDIDKGETVIIKE